MATLTKYFEFSDYGCLAIGVTVAELALLTFANLSIFYTLESLAKGYEKGADYVERLLITLYIAILFIAVILLKGITFAYLGHVITKRFHAKITNNLIRSPTYFFDSNPIGRVLTRFTKDCTIIDRAMFISIFQSLVKFSRMLGFVLGMCGGFYFYTPIAIVASLVYVFKVRRFYIPGLTSTRRKLAEKKTKINS